MKYIKRHFQKDDYLGRNGWYKKDIQVLKESYKSYPVKYPEWLIERHGRGGCHTKAHKLGLTKGIRNPGLDLRRLTIAEKAYFAGIIDGEGSIIFHEDRPKTNFCVEVSNTDEKVMIWIQKLFAPYQKVVYRKRERKSGFGVKENWKDVYQLYINGIMNVYDICRAILPYLIIKKEKAERALTLLKNKYNLR